MKVDIKIQSFSDIITNSSSEMFCKIKGEHLEEIYNFLRELLPNSDPEMGPVVTRWEKGEWDDDNSPAFISIDLPYGLDCLEFFKKGVKALLDQTFGKDFYTIEYDY